MRCDVSFLFFTQVEKKEEEGSFQDFVDDLVKQMIAPSEKFHFVFSHELQDRIQIKM